MTTDDVLKLDAVLGSELASDSEAGEDAQK